MGLYNVPVKFSEIASDRIVVGIWTILDYDRTFIREDG